MAATTATNYPLISKTVEGYVQANFSHRSSLLTSGVAGSVPQASMSEGNVWSYRGRIQYHDAWQTPAANTNLTVNALAQYKDTAPILRRADAFGYENAARILAGDQNALTDVGDIITDAFRYQLENTLFTYMLPGLFNTGGPLSDTTLFKVESTTNFSQADMSLARKLCGANSMGFNILFMHPDVFYGNEYDRIVTANDFDTIQEFATRGINYGGMLGGAMVILNDLLYNSAGVYHSYLVRRGSIALGYQKTFGIETDRSILLAGGTDIVKYDVYFSPVLFGVSYTGTAPTGLGGASDANLLLGTNWSVRKDQAGNSAISKGEIGVICIQSVG